MSRDAAESRRLKVFGKRVAEIRRAKGFTQESLAERANVTALTISYIEQGRQWPKISTLCEIARALNVEPLELVRGLK